MFSPDFDLGLEGLSDQRSGTDLAGQVEVTRTLSWATRPRRRPARSARGLNGAAGDRHRTGRAAGHRDRRVAYARFDIARNGTASFLVESSDVDPLSRVKGCRPRAVSGDRILLPGSRRAETMPSAVGKVCSGSAGVAVGTIEVDPSRE
jgi:hypothetical protein